MVVVDSGGAQPLRDRSIGPSRRYPGGGSEGLKSAVAGTAAGPPPRPRARSVSAARRGCQTLAGPLKSAVRSPEKRSGFGLAPARLLGVLEEWINVRDG